MEHQEPAVSEHDRGRDRREQRHEREIDRGVVDGLHVRGAVAVVDLAEALEVGALAPERLHHAHPRDVLLQARGDLAHPLARAPVGPRRVAAEDHGADGHCREHRQGRERQPPVEHEQDDGGADQDERVLQERRRAVGDHAVHGVDVVRQPRDDNARGGALEEAQVEPLDVGEDGRPQVGQHPLPDPARQVALGRRRRPSDHGDRQEDADPDDDAPVAPDADAFVDHLLGRERPGDGRDRGHDQRRNGQGRPAPVRTRVPGERARAARPLPAAHGSLRGLPAATRRSVRGASPSRSTKVRSTRPWLWIWR